MTEHSMQGPTRIAYIIGTYPLLTTTFIDRELEEVRAHGLQVDVWSLRRPDGALSPEQERLAGSVRYVLPVSMRALLASHLSFLLTAPHVLIATLALLLTRPHPDLRSRLKTVLHVSEGIHVAHLIRRGGYRHLHAHFVDRAAIVALVAGRLLGAGYSATAHANDIYVDPVLLPTKLAGARFIVTCTKANAEHLVAVAGAQPSVRIAQIYHGLDVDDYVPPRPEERARPPVILAVGQLKEKKGLTFLLEACRRLRDEGHEFTCDIVGEGPLRPDLEAQIDALSLQGTAQLLGLLPHRSVIERYRTASVFALPCIVGADGDRDGIPNVLLEAMAMQLPVVSTRHSGVPEAVVDGWSGALVPAGDPVALADALAGLLAAPSLRALQGRRGRQRVAEQFDITSNAKALIALFEEVIG